ncbi:MAG: hypothetical protein CVV25_06890 [Ignavibacteriae bacterium HGW-Ignavibacteriae-4]|jgi:hypothetical protein|nr:MAG: hypothetical protein CVV25_06890 [Ignavibacteriae bacterium HGW-Ignavibacteriae-4]
MKYIVLIFFLIGFNLSFSLEYTESHLKLADELIEISEMKDVDLAAIAAEVLDYFQITPEVENYQEIKETYIDSFKNDYMIQVRELYVSYYSEDDIKAILQFYKSDIGKKMLKNSELLSNDILLSAELWTEKMYSKLESMVDEESK